MMKRKRVDNYQLRKLQQSYFLNKGRITAAFALLKNFARHSYLSDNIIQTLDVLTGILISENEKMYQEQRHALISAREQENADET